MSSKKKQVHKCPACGEEYDSPTTCVGRPESGHVNEPTKTKPVGEADSAEAENAPVADAG